MLSQEKEKSIFFNIMVIQAPMIIFTRMNIRMQSNLHVDYFENWVMNVEIKNLPLLAIDNT